MECCSKNYIRHQPRNFSHPFVNLKIIVPNFVSAKRQLEESCLDNSYEAPHKRPYTPEALSPDLGCVMDSPVLGEEAISPIAASTPAPLAKTRAFNGGTEGESGPHQKHSESGLSDEPKCSAPSKAAPKKLFLYASGEPLPFNHASKFDDDDVDGIFSFSPVRPNAEEGFFDGVGSCKTPGSDTVQCKPGAHDATPPTGEVGGADGKVPRSAQECQAAFNGTTVDTSYETTLPLQVQVKSVVTVPNSCTFRKSAAAPLGAPKIQQPLRPVRLKSESEFVRRRYVQAVKSHLNQASNPGVMNELANLMTRVADETSNPNDRQWQHPADLTHRNYQVRFGNVTARVPLDEWYSQNYTSVKRFAGVPKIFKRHSLA